LLLRTNTVFKCNQGALFLKKIQYIQVSNEENNMLCLSPEQGGTSIHCEEIIVIRIRCDTPSIWWYSIWYDVSCHHYSTVYIQL